MQSQCCPPAPHGPTRRPRRRASLRLAVAALSLVPLAIGVRAEASAGVTSDDVAAEIVRLEAKADETAQRWTEAQQRAEDLAIEIAEAEVKVGESEVVFSAMQAQMERIAISRFTGAGSGSQLFFVDDPGDLIEEGILRSVALNTGATDLDAIDQARDCARRRPRQPPGVAPGERERARGPRRRARSNSTISSPTSRCATSS